MAFAPGAWVKENTRVYVGNATAVRDFRVQLRGNRAAVLWALYLVVLIGFGMLSYSNINNQGQISIVAAQERLHEFYMTIMAMLGVMITIVAPALTATAVVAERQRQSLDLVFSAPVSPKYFLVGKMISSYRYTWMMLMLSLPITSACVVLGGATWSDVAGAYVLLSFHALVYTSIALLMSTLAQKPVAAIIWSYIAAMFYAVASAGVSTGAGVGAFMSGGQEMPFIVTLNPFLVAASAPTYTVLWGHHVPNWVFMAIIAVLVSKFMLLSAASALSGFGATDTKSLRVHGALYLWALMFITAWFVTPMTGTAGPTAALGGPTHTDFDHGAALVFGWSLVPLLLVLPFLSCYGRDQEKKFWPDGTFRLRQTFVGTPSGGLPYLLLLVLGSAVSYGVAFWIRSGVWPGVEFCTMAFWAVSLWFFGWALGRWTSAGNTGTRVARTMHFAALVAIGALPIPFLTLISPNFPDAGGTSIWDLYIMRPIIGGRDNSDRAVIAGFALLLLGILVTLIAERGAALRGVRLRTNE